MVERELDIDGLLEKILQGPKRELLHRALARLMAEKLRARRERSVLLEAVRYQKSLAVETRSKQTDRLWWKNN